MAGIVPTVTSSKVFAFVLFVVLVWIAVDLGLVISGVTPGLPGSIRTLIAPSAAQADAQTKL